MSKEYVWYKVGWGGSIFYNGRVWTAWPWRRWVKVRVDNYGQTQDTK